MQIPVAGRILTCQDSVYPIELNLIGTDLRHFKVCSREVSQFFQNISNYFANCGTPAWCDAVAILQALAEPAEEHSVSLLAGMLWNTSVNFKVDAASLDYLKSFTVVCESSMLFWMLLFSCSRLFTCSSIFRTLVIFLAGRFVENCPLLYVSDGVFLGSNLWTILSFVLLPFTPLPADYGSSAHRLVPHPGRARVQCHRYFR